MNILVTGCAGLLGSNFCHWLIRNTHHTVIGVDNLSGGYKENMPNHERFIFAELDINSDHLHDLFAIYHPKVVYAMAAYASEGRADYIRRYIHQNNVVGMANVINACINSNSKLIFTSSVAVYSGHPPFHEETVPNPPDEYAIGKRMVELSIQIAGERHKMEWVIVRPRNVYGVRQSIFDPSRNLIGIFCYNALNKLPLTIFGSGNNKRCFTYIDDILAPLHRCMDYTNQIINLGSSIPYSINAAAHIFGEVTGYKNIIHTEERHEVKDAICLTSKSEALLGYKDKTSLKDGITKMWEWCKTIPMRPKQIPPPLEVTKNKHSSII